MPKSKREHKKIVNSKGAPRVVKKGKASKEQLVTKLRTAIENISVERDSIYVFTVEHPRNTSVAQLRELLNPKLTSLFFGKSSVMKIALGKEEADELQANVHQLTPYVVGGAALIVTQLARDEVESIVNSFVVPQYARSGAIAIDDYAVPAGPLDQSSPVGHFSMEAQLRKLGLPTLLKNGVINVVNDVIICKKGDVLTPEQCKLLELFEQQHAVFRVNLLAVWEKGEVTQLNEPKPVAAQQMDDDDADGEDD